MHEENQNNMPAGVVAAEGKIEVPAGGIKVTAQTVKNSPAMQETGVGSLGQEDQSLS